MQTPIETITYWVLIILLLAGIITGIVLDFNDVPK